jgi:EmrB/QacA subfamily drug resistance transporter
VACALAPTVGWLIAARAAQGAGAALVIPLGLALLTAAFPAAERGRAIGIFSAVTGIAVAAGPLVGGAVVAGLAWQWIFWLNVPIGALAVPFVLTRMDESLGPRVRIDVRGTALVTAAALGIVFGLVRGNDAGWASAEVLGSLAIGAACTIAFVGFERRAADPMLPLGLFRSRAFSAGNAATFFTFASLFSAVFFFAQLFQAGLGDAPLGTGVRLAAWTVTFITVAPAAGALTDRLGERPFLVVGLVLQAVGMAWVARVAAPDVAYGTLVAPLVVAGVGVSLAIPAAQASVVGAVAPELVGKAAGVNSMMRQLGGVFGVALTVAVFGARGGYASPQAFVDGFAPAIAVAAALSIAGALAAAVMPARGASDPAAHALARVAEIPETGGSR